MESIFADIDKNKLAPQRFGYAITLIVICLVLSYVHFFADKPMRRIVHLLNLLVCIPILVEFAKYLNNFNARKAIRIVKWKIAGIIVVFLFSFVNFLSGIYRNQLSLLNEYWVKVLMLSLLSVVVIFFDLVVSIVFGLALQKIKNDFIGLTKAMGIMHAYVLPIPILLTTVMTFYSPWWALYHTDANLLVRLAVHTLFLLPTIFMLIIFIRAERFQFRNDI